MTEERQRVHHGLLCSIVKTMQREYPEAPLVGVGAVLVDEKARVLLIKRGHEPMKGCWSLPGGLVELGESLSDAVRRELLEETSLHVEVLALVELLDRIDRTETGIRYHYVIADYLCRVTGGRLAASDDAADARWASPEDFDRLHLDAVTLRVIEAGLRIYNSL